MIEFALTFPVILLVAFCSLEFSRWLRDLQVATAIAQEVVDVAYRDCSSEIDSTLPPAADATDCLMIIRNRIISRWQGLAPNAEIIVSQYRFDGATITLDASVTDPAYNNLTKFSASSLTNSNSLTGAALMAHSVIVVAEVYLPFSSPVSFLPGINPQGDFIYDSAII